MTPDNYNSHPAESADIAVGMLKGALAGAVGVWVMDRVDWFMFEHEDQDARHQTEQVRPEGMDPAHHTVNKVANAAGKDLSPSQPNAPGVAMHYGLGVAPGALYGALRDRVPAIGTGRGSLFGLGLYLMQDEGLNTLMGSAAKPNEYPWQAHARGLISHVVYGVATDTTLRLLNRAGRA